MCLAACRAHGGARHCACEGNYAGDVCQTRVRALDLPPPGSSVSEVVVPRADLPGENLQPGEWAYVLLRPAAGTAEVVAEMTRECGAATYSHLWPQALRDCRTSAVLCCVVHCSLPAAGRRLIMRHQRPQLGSHTGQ
jgi:hypothetical protein